MELDICWCLFVILHADLSCRETLIHGFPVNVNLILFIEFVAYMLVFVRGTCCVLDFYSWNLDTCVFFSSVKICTLTFLLVKLIFFIEFVACWSLFVELVACWFLFVKLDTCVIFLFGKFYIGFPSQETDFVYRICCVLIFVRGACCVLIFVR